jgi:hypothetical protein
VIQLDYGVWLVTRGEWGARPPNSVTGLSVDTDTDHWGGPGFGAPFPHESCPAKVRAWQNFHMDSRGWSDIAYNAVACPHGFLFEGRGRGRRSAANGTTAGNSGSYATCYLGGEGDDFTEAGKRAMRASGNWLTRAGSRRLGHRDWKSTTCPGGDIYAWVHAGQPITIPTPTPVSKEDDEVKFQVIVSDAPRNWYKALVPGNPLLVWPGEMYEVGLELGYFHPVRLVNPRQYDVALDTFARAGPLFDTVALEAFIERQANPKKIVQDPLGNVYITDFMQRERILGWDAVNWIAFADGAETRDDGTPYPIEQNVIDGIPDVPGGDASILPEPPVPPV